MTKYHEKCDYESSDDECHKKYRCKRGKRGYPGFQGPQGVTGPASEGNQIFYGELLSSESQVSNGSINPILLNSAPYLNGISYTDISIIGLEFSVINIENPGLYFINYNLSFSNTSSVEANVVGGLAYFPITGSLDFFDVRIETISRSVSESDPSYLSLSSSRYLNITEPASFFLVWFSSSPDVELTAIFPVNSAEITITQISSAVPVPPLRALNSENIDLSQIKEKLLALADKVLKR